MLKHLAIWTITATVLASCANAATSVTVRNKADNTTTTINVKNGEGATTTVKVSTPVSLDSLQFDFLNNKNNGN